MDKEKKKKSLNYTTATHPYGNNLQVSRYKNATKE
jgi:hypothetical protein